MTRTIRDQIDALRAGSAALGELSETERIERVAALLDAWAPADSPWQKELCEMFPAATGFSIEMVREGCARGFAPLRGQALRPLIDLEEAAPARKPTVCASILAGSIPMPTLLAAVAPLALGSAVALKASAADPISPRLVARSAAEVDPLLGRCVDVVTLSQNDEEGLLQLLGADVASITGSDEGVEWVASRSRPGTPVVRHGHRFSAAVVGDRATRGDALEETAQGLALDIALWDQLGCLSPIGVWVVDRDPRACDRFVESLASALAAAERRWPRSALDTASKAAFAHALATDQLREAAGAGVYTRTAGEWCVVREGDPLLRPVPLFRFIRVYPAHDVAAVCTSIGGDREHLAALAVAGLDQNAETALRELRPSRVCVPGALQTPPLAWRRDHLGVLSSLSLAGQSS